MRTRILTAIGVVLCSLVPLSAQDEATTGRIEGRVVQATSTNHQDLLDGLLNLDAGARYIGEFGVGWNYGIDRFIYETLFDEKIGGTIHLALGQAYLGNKGTNKSALHWDIVKDLRTEGEIYLDGDKVMENGKFLV